MINTTQHHVEPTLQKFTEGDIRERLIDKIVANRLSTCSESYWEDLLRGGFRGLNEWTLEELRTEVALFEDDA